MEWFKPRARPTWLTAEAFAALPTSILVRELRYCIQQPGYRTREVTLVTKRLQESRGKLWEEMRDRLIADFLATEGFLNHPIVESK